MRTDELRAELAELAHEVDPFAADVRAVRRRVNRSRITTAAAAIVVAAAAVSGVVALAHSRSSHVRVAHSAKDVALDQLPRLDAVVVMPAGATDDKLSHVQTLLDDTNGVEQYASLPAGSLAFVLSAEHNVDATRLHTQVCANPSIRSFGVMLARQLPDAEQQLTAAAGGRATVLPIGSHVSDVEIFMSITAAHVQVSSIRDRIARDPDVAKYTFLDHMAAYAEFKTLFADQPVLIQNETPQGLPESFRLDLRDGVSLESVAARYQDLPGVKQVITRSTDLALRPPGGFTQTCPPAKP